jgi:hypothetical protein
VTLKLNSNGLLPKVTSGIMRNGPHDEPARFGLQQITVGSYESSVKLMGQ